MLERCLRNTILSLWGAVRQVFAALELTRSSHPSVLLIEKGLDIDARQCPARGDGGSCISCLPCHIVCGLGGAGALSDGKLTLSSEVGGHLIDYLGENGAQALIKDVDDTYLKFCVSDKLYEVGDEVEKFRQQASFAGLHLIPVPLRHLGTEHCCLVLKALRDYLAPSVDFKLGTMVSKIIASNGRVSGSETGSGEKFDCHSLILSPGREGADWLSKEANRINLTMHSDSVDVGVRVEVPTTVMDDSSSVLYEAKLEFIAPSFSDRIRIFCMCPTGEVFMEATGGDDPVVTVNGRSYASRTSSNNTNFALLVSTNFTEPFREPIAYGKYLAGLANILSGGVLVQRLGDMIQGRRSTPDRIKRALVRPTLKSAVPGDLSFVLPYRHFTGILVML